MKKIILTIIVHIILLNVTMAQLGQGPGSSISLSDSLPYSENSYLMSSNDYWLSFNAQNHNYFIQVLQDLSISNNYIDKMEVYEVVNGAALYTQIANNNYSHLSKSFDSLKINTKYYIKLHRANATSNLNFKIQVTPINNAAPLPLNCEVYKNEFENGIGQLNITSSVPNVVYVVNSNATLAINNPYANATSGNHLLSVNLIGNSPMFNVQKSVCNSESYRISFRYRNINISSSQGSKLPRFKFEYGMLNGVPLSQTLTAPYEINPNTWCTFTTTITTPATGNNTLKLNFISDLFSVYPQYSNAYPFGPNPIYGTTVNPWDIYGCDLGIEDIKIESLSGQKPILTINGNTISNSPSLIYTFCNTDPINLSAVNDFITNPIDFNRVVFQYSYDLGNTWNNFLGSPGVTSVALNPPNCFPNNLVSVRVIPSCNLIQCDNQNSQSAVLRIIPKPTITNSSVGTFCSPYALPTLNASISCNTTLAYTFQWYNAVTNTEIIGATNQTFQPSISGDYYVEIGYNYGFLGGMGYCKSNSIHVDIAPICPCDLGMNSSNYNYSTDFLINEDTRWTPTTAIINGGGTSYPGPTVVGGNIYVNCVITVKAGKHFEIDPGVTVYFGNNGKIVLERGSTMATEGASLYAKAATLTGVSSPADPNLGCMWQGIDAQGYSGTVYSSNPRPYAVVQLEGCTVEHAACAVYAGMRPINTTWYNSNSSRAGGYTYINNCIFRNNFISVLYPNGSIASETDCYIMNTEFKCSAPVRQPSYCNNPSTNPSARSLYFVKSTGWLFVHGLIENCGFRNTNDATMNSPISLATTNKTIAIDNTNSRITPTKCRFSCVEKGIWNKNISGVSSNYMYGKITCNSFEFCRQGILVTGANTRGNFIVRNEFKKGLPSISGVPTQVGAAVILDGVSGTEVTNNIIEDCNNGVLCFNSTSTFTQAAINISKNSFSYTNIAPFNAYSVKQDVVLGGTNGNTQIRCNNFNIGYNNAIRYVSQTQYSNTTSLNAMNIADQGSITVAAGNTFGNSTIGAALELSRNSMNGIVGNYFYASFSNNTPTNVSLVPIQPANPAYTSTSQYCASSNGLPTSLLPAPAANCFTSAYSFPLNPNFTVSVSNDNPILRSIVEIQQDIDNTTDEYVLDKLYTELLNTYELNNQEDDAKIYFEQVNTVDADKELIDLYMKDGEYLDVAAVLATLPDGSMDELAYKELYQIFVDLGLQNRTMEELSVAEETLITAIAQLDYKSSATAINILVNYFNWEYSLSCEKLGLCDGSNSRKAGGNDALDQFLNAVSTMKVEREEKNSKGIHTFNTKTTSFKLVPNPSSGNTNIYFHSNEKISMFELINISGQIVQKNNLTDTNSTFNFDTTYLPNGIYQVKISLTNGKTLTEKLIIHH